VEDTGKKRLNRWCGAIALCFALVGCGAPVEPFTSTIAPTATREPIATHAPTQTLASAPSRTPTPMPTPTPTATPTSTPVEGSEQSPESFQGCWQFETEDVLFEMKLEQQGADVQGTFLLIKVCVVEGTPSACRIREALLEGTVAMDELRLRLSIPEYDDEGAVLLKLADDGETLFWEELEYPEVGLSDGGPHYLPPKFTLTPCDV
jgi:hypothetical protein